MTKIKSLLILSLTLILVTGPVLTIQTEVKSIHLDEDWNQPIFTQSEVQSSQSVELDTTGYDFIDAIKLNPINTTGVRTFTITSEFNSSHEWIFFKYFVNETNFVKISLEATYNFNQFYMGFQAYSGPTYEDSVGFPFEFEPPFTLEYFSPNVAEHYIEIFAGDFNDGFIDEGEEISFTLTIQQYFGSEGGPVIEDQELRDFQSDAYVEMGQIEQYFENRGYFDVNTGNVNLGDFNSSDHGFMKGIASAVFGITRMADLYSNAGFDLTEDPILIKYLNYANELLAVANDTLDPAGRLIYRASESNPVSNDYTFYLEDSIYYLMILGELRYLGQFVIDPASLTYDAFAIPNQELATTNAILTEFALTDANGVGDQPTAFMDSFSVSGFTGALTTLNQNLTIGDWDLWEFGDSPAAPSYDAIDPSTKTNSTNVSFESLSLMLEVFRWASTDFSNFDNRTFYESDGFGGFYSDLGYLMDSFDPLSVIRDQILTFITEKMFNNTVPGITLEPTGIGIETYDLNADQQGQISTVLGNSYLIMYVATLISDANFNDNQLASDLLNIATELATNSLRLFTDEETGLLYSRINVTDTNYEKIISTLYNGYFIAALTRLNIAWKNAIGIDDTVKQTIARTWARKILDMLGYVKNTLYDDVDQSYFAAYDAQANTILVDDNNVRSNNFVANAYLLNILSGLFPIQMAATAQDKLLVGEDGQITLDLTQILTAQSWI